jgi:hypothetical protein
MLGEEAAAGPDISRDKEAGYRGIWFTLGQKKEFGDKYSGGLGTYTANHVPMAIYSKEADKTFFVYGGGKNGTRHLLAMASYFDHRRGVVPRPTIVHDKQGVDDPHDNPCLSIDGEGYVWVFVSGRGRERPGIIYCSNEPYSVDAFTKVAEREFTYPQIWWRGEEGFAFLFTKYTKGRELYASQSRDGLVWSPDEKFAGMGGHYQTSWFTRGRLITAFNMHPGGDVDKRTNLYYLASEDGGRSWQTVEGAAVKTPLADVANSALVHDFQAEGRLVYIHDLDLDREGRPVILFTASRHAHPGPPGDPRWWTIARWLGDRWAFTEMTRANHNYTTGSLWVSDDGPWRVIGPTEPGPQPIGAGGEVAVWASHDQGATWKKERDVTRASSMNHNYVRRVLHAHPGFAAFWSDGNPDEFSPSRLYFTDATGEHVWQLPADMTSDFAEPTLRKA